MSSENPVEQRCAEITLAGVWKHPENAGMIGGPDGLVMRVVFAALLDPSRGPQDKSFGEHAVVSRFVQQWPRPLTAILDADADRADNGPHRAHVIQPDRISDLQAGGVKLEEDGNTDG